ncbi:response regulator [Leptolyngbya sp. NK1-12]|uniref:Response regulator n=2 Tax=Leptolyngbya sp. NK1-12 TaxID=2547451 RepID=A0AA96WQ52_9CYAN|nr:response regulator [Elainella sp. C42_A2020_010]RNJ65085.1 MAG: response regulator [Leptolyngbya sp. IPPAS B-1204]WNZ27141.1 response regulator [Leptolyngbya sp. NK1-12]
MMTKRILIVDDEYDIRAVVQLTLKAVGGWDVASAASGQEGLEKAVGQSPDVILLDVMMPEMDGIETFRALQANPVTQPIPVILMTAKVQAAEQRRFAELEVAGIITKPFKAMKLPGQIAKILGWNDQ